MRKDLILFDAIAISSIVLFHASSLAPPGWWWIYLGYFGILIFAISAGAKFAGHSLNDRIFLKTYAKKRFFRLYKPYVFYTLLVLPIMLAMMTVSEALSLGYKGFGLQLNLDTLYNFLMGNNTISFQLWYLVSLLEVTAFCIGILYFASKKVLYIFFPISVLIYLIYGIHLDPSHIMTSRFLLILPAFIFGMWLPILPLSPGPLAGLGKYSFAIYLFHAPITIAVVGLILAILHLRSAYAITIITIFLSIAQYKSFKFLRINKLLDQE
jgi:peptidoglycan/LPS O-acetylase OafA/YrhL